MSRRPRIAVVLGDPAGVGPELVARLLATPATLTRADVVVVGDRDELAEGARIAGVTLDYDVTPNRTAVRSRAGRPLLFDYRGTASRPFVRATVSENGGRYALDTLAAAIELTCAGTTDALCFAPLNKASLHEAGLTHEDEGQWFAERLGVRGRSGELNVLGGLMTSRVTSHVAIKDVAGLITEERVVGAIRLVYDTLVSMGIAEPRIAVCGLNPHAGESGNFGREEIDVIAPAIERSVKTGRPALGPFPADTVFLKAADVDAIVTMYHDQGQIAMKLMGFSRGVTFYGGLPIPIATPAHGTAFDIYGQGRANPGAILAAFDMLCRVVASRIATAGPQ
jgi:4-hydroxythreonine-4-phosphate dehydrogenase